MCQLSNESVTRKWNKFTGNKKLSFLCPIIVTSGYGGLIMHRDEVIILVVLYLELDITLFPKKNNITDVRLLQLTNKEKIGGKSGD